MTKQTRNSRRLRSAALAFATAASLAVLAPSISVAAETVLPKTSTATPVDGQTPTIRQTPAYGQSPTSVQTAADQQNQLQHRSSTQGQPLSRRETATSGQNPTHGTMTMQGMTHTGNVDQDFAANLRMHHAMGVEMARAQVKDGQDPEMTRVARKLIDAQQAEIVVLDRWLASNKVSAPDADPR